MRIWPFLGAWGFLVALALTMSGALGPLGGGRQMAQAQEAGPAPGESNKNEGRRLDRLEFDRKYCEYERVRLDQKPTRPVPIVCVVPEGSWFRPDGSWFLRRAPHPRGDFWTPGELQRLYRR